MKIQTDCCAITSTNIALIHRIQQGDQGALERLYVLFWPKVFGLVLRILRVTSDAEEVSSDVFHHIWLNSMKFDSNRGDPAQWIMVIARSRALDRYRQQVRYRYLVHLPKEIDAYSESGESSHSPLTHEYADGSNLQQAIAGLSLIQSELVKLAFFQYLSHREIAALKQLPLGTVKSHINRACKEFTSSPKRLGAADLRQNLSRSWCWISAETSADHYSQASLLIRCAKVCSRDKTARLNYL